MLNLSQIGQRALPTGLLAVIVLLALLAPVYPQTQSEMNAQARKDFNRADAELGKVYKALLERLGDAEGKRKLQESQRAWVAFRDAEASFAADEVRGGTMAPVLRYGSMTETTESRIKQLKSDFPQ